MAIDRTSVFARAGEGTFKFILRRSPADRSISVWCNGAPLPFAFQGWREMDGATVAIADHLVELGLDLSKPEVKELDEVLKIHGLDRWQP